jgi:hypothetical protein
MKGNTASISINIRRYNTTSVEATETAPQQNLGKSAMNRTPIRESAQTLAETST